MKVVRIGILWMIALGAADLAAKRLRVVLYENPPLIEFGGGAKFHGIIPEFLDSLDVGREGFEFDYVRATFPEALQMIREGEADILPGVAFTYERQEFMEFSKVALVRNRAVVYRRSDVPVSMVEDLQGKRVALLEGDVHARAFRELIGIYGLEVEEIEVNRYESAVELLETGEAELAVLNQIYASRLDRNRTVVSTMISFNPIAIRIGFRPGLPADWISEFDRELSLQKEDPDSPLNQAILRYLSPSVRIEVPAWVWVLLPFLAFAVLVAVFFNRVLRREVRRRTEELKAQKDRAEAGDRAKAHFLSNVSHEIRTPLNGILGFCQLLDASDKLHGEDRGSVEAILESSNRLECVLNAILNYSAVVTGSRMTSADAVSLEDLAVEVFEVLSVRLDFPIGKIDCDLDGMDGTIFRTDRNAWYLILEGLLANAIKFGKGGRVGVRFRKVGESPGGIRLRLEVSDGGEGIPVEMQDRILLPFEQVDGSLSRPYEGVGLGLSLVKVHVDQLRGVLGFGNPGEERFVVFVEADLEVVSGTASGKSP